MADNKDNGFKRWATKKKAAGKKHSHEDYDSAHKEHAQREKDALLRRGRLMDKNYIRTHPHVVVPDKWKPSEHPDPRNWTDTKGVEHFGNKRYVVGAY